MLLELLGFIVINAVCTALLFRLAPHTFWGPDADPFDNPIAGMSACVTIVFTLVGLVALVGYIMTTACSLLMPLRTQPLFHETSALHMPRRPMSPRGIN